MGLSWLFLLVAVGAVFGEENSTETESKISVTAIIQASGTPDCVHSCLSDLFDASAEILTLQNPAEKFPELCTIYRNASLCVDEEEDCIGGQVLETAFSGLDTLCGEEASELENHTDCLANSTEQIAVDCDISCGFAESIVELSESEAVFHIAKLRKHELLMKELAPVCSSLGCMSACMASGMNEECEAPAGTIVMEALLKPFFKSAAILDAIGPRAKEAVKRQLPEDCWYLIDTEQLAAVTNGTAPGEDMEEGSAEGSGDEGSAEGSGDDEGSGDEGSGDGSGDEEEEGSGGGFQLKRGRFLRRLGFVADKTRLGTPIMRGRNHFLVFGSASRSTRTRRSHGMRHENSHDGMRHENSHDGMRHEDSHDRHSSHRMRHRGPRGAHDSHSHSHDSDEAMHLIGRN